jgi:probable rRNA maturation factor
MNQADLTFRVDWATRSKMRGPGEGSLGDLLLKLRNRLAPKAMGVGITYVDDRAMRKLNREHRGINLTTDVLSFPAEPEPGAFPHLGDLVISLPVAEKMAKKLGVSRRREVETLVIHGFLHLCGYDHETDKGEMLALQAELERELLEAEPLPMSLRRGRKPGSKVKVLKDGSKVVVTGRAAVAVKQKQAAAKVAAKAAAKTTRSAKAKPAADKPRRGPGRPRKVRPEAAPEAQARRVPRRRKAPKPRSGVIA